MLVILAPGREAREKAEGRGQRAEGRGQRAEGRGQRAEVRGQRSKSNQLQLGKQMTSKKCVDASLDGAVSLVPSFFWVLWRACWQVPSSLLARDEASSDPQFTRSGRTCPSTCFRSSARRSNYRAGATQGNDEHRQEADSRHIYFSSLSLCRIFRLNIRCSLFTFHRACILRFQGASHNFVRLLHRLQHAAHRHPYPPRPGPPQCCR